MRKHHRVIATYYMKYMSGFDAQLMRNVVMVRKWCALASVRLCGGMGYAH